MKCATSASRKNTPPGAQLLTKLSQSFFTRRFQFSSFCVPLPSGRPGVDLLSGRNEHLSQGKVCGRSAFLPQVGMLPDQAAYLIAGFE
jgi:hypothetical protein